MEIQKLKNRLDEIKDQIDDLDLNDLGDAVYKLEDDINDMIRSSDPDNTAPFDKLLKEIKKLKKENDFYNADDELDRMFPNRHDDDFDEDSMSYDSVFGDD